MSGRYWWVARAGGGGSGAECGRRGRFAPVDRVRGLGGDDQRFECRLRLPQRQYTDLTGPPTTPPATTAPPPVGTGCHVTYPTNAWNTGLTASITIANTSSTAVNGWTLGFTLPTGQATTSGWNATFSPSSGQVAARDVSYNATIPATGSVNIGFQANHTGNTGEPSSSTLNGSPCAVA